MANTPNDKFIVTIYNMIEPNRTECGTDMPNCNIVFITPLNNIAGKESDADISTIYESKVWTRIYYEVDMGIPAYYKKLIRSVPGLVSVHPHAVSWLFMDFNCLIYHCIPVVYEMGLKIEDFESALITEVVRYTREVVKEVAPSKGVYIAIDGVVPMAKMRQQRLRRFKSVWEKEHAVHTQRALPEMALPSEKEHAQAKWDTNAITPGTVFMKNLAAALQAMCNEKGWILQERDYSFILTYCFAMSVLGNDFLPSSLGLKMRDGGHDELLRCLTMPLIDEEYNLMGENLFELFRVLSLSEHHRIMRYVQGKQRMAHNAVDTGFGESNWPLTQIETCLLDGNWTTQYWRLVGGDPLDVCAEYVKGIKWIWAYYTGQPVCFNWFYPYPLPPTWSSLVQMGPDSLQIGMPLEVHMRVEEIRPVEQLSLVLPLQSWSLIPDCPEKQFPKLAPQFFPSSFEFETVGHRFWWEITCKIPIPTIVELKGLLCA